MQMSYHNKIELEIEPVSSPEIIRNCSKCGGKARFSNTENFRVNANGKYIDIWLIYACCQCKSTYNMTIFERISSSELRREAYEKFLSNDKSLAMSYGCNGQIFKKNKVEVDWENIIYRTYEKTLKSQEYQDVDVNEKDKVYEKDKDKVYEKDKEFEIDKLNVGDIYDFSVIKDGKNSRILKIKCKYPLKIRLDKFLSEYLNISRTKVKYLLEKEIIKELKPDNINKKYISNGMEFILRQIS